MNQMKCEWMSRFKLTLSIILLNGLAITGCATLGDIETANQHTQASLNSYKKESREKLNDLSKEIRSLRKEIQNLQNKDQAFDQGYDKINKENQDLRASLVGVTATIQAFLNAEKRRHEEGLRWIDTVNKSMGNVSPQPSGTIPQKQSPPTAESSPETPAAIPSPSTTPSSETPAVAAAAPNPPPETPVVSAPSPSPPSGTVETPPAASIPEEETTVSTQTEGLPIKIKEITIDPPTVERKSKMKVTVKYEVEGNSDGPKFKYLEQVVLLKGTLSIQNLKDTVERAPGTNFFSRTIEVPTEAPTGVYTIKAVVSSGSSRNSKIKTFIVK